MRNLKFLADENLFSAIYRGLLRRKPDLDIVRVQDVGLIGADDPAVLQWAADHERVVLTHDIKTMPEFGYERIAAGKFLPGIIYMHQGIKIGLAIEDILLILECMEPDEFANSILKLPL